MTSGQHLQPSSGTFLLKDQTDCLQRRFRQLVEFGIELEINTMNTKQTTRTVILWKTVCARSVLTERSFRSISRLPCEQSIYTVRMIYTLNFDPSQITTQRGAVAEGRVTCTGADQTRGDLSPHRPHGDLGKMLTPEKSRKHHVCY